MSQQVVLMLIDEKEPFHLSDHQNPFRIMLKDKFIQLGKGYSKWIEAKVKYLKQQHKRKDSYLTNDLNFLPIEFFFDDYLVIQAMKTIRPQYSNLVRQFPFVMNRKSLFQLSFKEWFSDPLLQSSESFRLDPDIAFMIVSFNGRQLATLSDEFQKDKRIVLTAVKNDGFAYLYASEELKNDPEIIMAAVKADPITLEESVFERYPEIAIEYLVQHYNTSLSYLFKDKHVVLEAVKRNINVYSNVNMKYELKKDREIILAIAPVNITLLDHVKEANVFHDRDFCLNLVKVNYSGFKYLSAHLRNDEEILLTCLIHDPSLISLSERRNDKEFILKALNLGCKILPYISSEIVNDEIFEKFKENETLQSEVLQLEEDLNDFMMAPYEEEEEEPKVEKKLNKKDYEIIFKRNLRNEIKEIVRKNPHLLRFAGEELLSDRQFALECVLYKEEYINFFKLFKNDKDFVLHIIELGNFTNIGLAEHLVYDSDFKQQLIELILQRNAVFCKVPNFLIDCQEILLSSMKATQENFSFTQITSKLLETKEFVMKALKVSPYFFLFFDLYHDEDCRMAVLRDHGLITNFSDIKTREEFDNLLRERMNYAYSGGTFNLH